MLRGFREYSLLIYYAVLILLLLFIPGGLLAGLGRLVNFFAPTWIGKQQAASTAIPAPADKVKRLPQVFARPASATRAGILATTRPKGAVSGRHSFARR